MAARLAMTHCPMECMEIRELVPGIRNQWEETTEGSNYRLLFTKFRNETKRNEVEKL